MGSDAGPSCARCGGDVDLHDSYVIGFAKSAAMEWIYLCPECEVALGGWMAAHNADDPAEAGPSCAERA